MAVSPELLDWMLDTDPALRWLENAFFLDWFRRDDSHHLLIVTWSLQAEWLFWLALPAFREAVLGLFADPARAPTAIMVGNLVLATGVLRGLHRLGLSVPGDVSVVGYDNDPAYHGEWTNNIATIDAPKALMAETAVDHSSKSIFSTPMPCSPVTLPPKSMQV